MRIIELDGHGAKWTRAFVFGGVAVAFRKLHLARGYGVECNFLCPKTVLLVWPPLTNIASGIAVMPTHGSRMMRCEFQQANRDAMVDQNLLALGNLAIPNGGGFLSLRLQRRVIIGLLRLVA